jgi:hypothetical protein
MSDTINPGIQRTVALLNEHDFPTCDSGDGETHDHPCDREGGYVVVKLRRPESLFVESHRLLQLLYASTLPGGEWRVNANYDPDDGHVFLDVSPMHDRWLL